MTENAVFPLLKCNFARKQFLLLQFLRHLRFIPVATAKDTREDIRQIIQILCRNLCTILFYFRILRIHYSPPMDVVTNLSSYVPIQISSGSKLCISSFSFRQSRQFHACENETNPYAAGFQIGNFRFPSPILYQFLHNSTICTRIAKIRTRNGYGAFAVFHSLCYDDYRNTVALLASK